MQAGFFASPYNMPQKQVAEGLGISLSTVHILAKKLGIPQPDVSRNETGVRRVDLVEFLEIAKTIGFNPLEFIKKLEES